MQKLGDETNIVTLAQKGEFNDRDDTLLDLFCGGGGSGGGLLEANDMLGRRVKGTFVNHWDKAIQIHEANHGEHRHLKEDVFLLDPEAVFPVGTSCSLLWASPSCTHFSVARGATCVNEQDRSHAFTVTDWVRHLKPEAVICENVKEFLGFGPTMQKRRPKAPRKGELIWAQSGKPVQTPPRGWNRRRGESETDWGIRMLAAGYQRYEVPDPDRKGEYFAEWIKEMDELGYEADWKILRSADYGDPTIRQRLFVYFVRKDSGKKIVWPEPYAENPKAKEPADRPMNWITTRQIIDWTLKGESVFTRKRKLADNTFRRLAIGLVKFGLKDFLVSSAHGSNTASDCQRRAHSLDEPAQTLTQKGERGLVQPATAEFMTPNFGERPGQTPRTHDVDEPLPTVTSHGAGGIVESEEYILPKDQGHDKRHVKPVDHPMSAITTNHRGEGLVEPSIIQLKGQSTAQSVDEPLSALTAKQAHYVSQPMLDHLRGQGVAGSVDEPLRTQTAGGSHHAIAEAFMFSLDQTGGQKNPNHGCYDVDEPLRTVVTKANASCIEFEFAEMEDVFLHNCEVNGVDTERARTFLNFLIEELHRKGKVDAKPWVYVYYSNGAEGKEIDAPLPTVRTKAGHALVYPVIEMDGKFIKIDLFYRMLTPLELQRAMGFPDDMDWAGCSKTDQIRAIGNSVSRGVARALGLAWYSQDPDVWQHVKPLYEKYVDKDNTSTQHVAKKS